ncbi:MAG: MBG domain-containing protein, partial [Syntrophales bacterium]
MTRKIESEAAFPMLNSCGRVRLTLLGVLACSLLAFGFILLLQTPAQAWPHKYASCSSSACHGAAATATPAAVINVAINGNSGTTITAAPGATFEVDWMFTNMKYSTNYTGTGVEVAVPTGWTVTSGTANSPALTGWSSAWEAADGVGWATGSSYSTATEFPNSPVGYTINYSGSLWDNGSRNSALDDASAGDLDGVANKMGADARITIPAGTTPGTYTIVVSGVGHNESNSKAHIEQAITVTVASGGTTPQNPAVSVTGPSSITYPNTGQVTYSGGQGTGAMSYSSTGSTGCSVNTSTGVITVTNASGSCSVTATKAGDATYAPSTSSSYTVTLNKATPTLSVTNSPVTYDGTAKSATVTGSVAGTPSSVLTGGAANQTTAGTYAVTANFTPTDTNNYNSLTAASAGDFIISKATPTASVTNSPVTYDGAAKSAAVACLGGGASSNILTGGAANQTNAGTYAVTADCAASTNYNAAAGISAGNFIINKATPTLSVTNSPVTYDGSAKSAMVTGSVAGTPSSVLTGGAASQTNAGIYAVTANFTPTDTTNYNSLTAASAGNFIINKATPTLSVTNSPVTYDGSAKSATVNGSVAGTPSSVLTGGAASQTTAGTYAVTANFTPTDTTNYNSLTAASAGNFIINKATPT